MNQFSDTHVLLGILQNFQNSTFADTLADCLYNRLKNICFVFLKKQSWTIPENVDFWCMCAIFKR